MSADIYRRCGCRGTDGKQYPALPDRPNEAQRSHACPKMSDANHGTWGYYVAAGLDPVTGKRRQIRKAGFATKRGAQQARNEVATKLDKGTYRAPAKITVSEYVTAWLPRHAASGRGLKPTTVFNYERYVRMEIVPSTLGRMLLSDVRRYHVNAFIESLMDAGRGATTVRRIAAVVQSAFRSAYDEQIIDDNPAMGTRLPHVDKHELEVWTPAQVGQFLDIAAHHRLGVLFEVVMFTGMRRGEALALRWSDIDLVHSQITIRANRTQVGAKVIEQTPKTAAGARTLDIADATVGALAAWQIDQADERARWGAAYVDAGYVFTKENGEPLLPQFASRLFDKLRLHADLPKLTFHGQRHEAVSLMLNNGVPLAIASKRVGHSSVQITADLYGHMIGSTSKDAAEQAVALVPRVGAHTLHTQAE